MTQLWSETGKRVTGSPEKGDKNFLQSKLAGQHGRTALKGGNYGCEKEL
jgi:hypothetical protein